MDRGTYALELKNLSLNDICNFALAMRYCMGDFNVIDDSSHSCWAWSHGVRSRLYYN